MKKFISIIIAVALTAAIGLAFAGCGKKEPAPAEPTQTQVADVRLGFVDYEQDDELLGSWLSDEYKYSNVIAENFGLGVEGAKSFYESAYFVYGVSVEIVNNTDSAIEVTGIESGTNGNNNVYVRNDFSGSEIGVEAHSASAATLQVICADENATDEQVIAQVRAMVFNLTYNQGSEKKSVAVKLEDGVEVNGAPAASGETIRFSDGGFVFSEALWEKYKDDTQANRTALKAGFGVNDDFVNEFYKDSASNNFFNYPVLVQNMSEHDVVILDVTAANAGTDGICVNVAFTGEMGIPAYDPDSTYMLPTFAVQVLCDDDDLSDEQVKSVVDAMEFSVTYAEKVVDGDPDSEELKEEQTITVTIG